MICLPPRYFFEVSHNLNVKYFALQVLFVIRTRIGGKVQAISA